MRAINTTNFEQSNVEYVQFWLMDFKCMLMEFTRNEMHVPLFMHLFYSQ